MFLFGTPYKTVRNEFRKYGLEMNCPILRNPVVQSKITACDIISQDKPAWQGCGCKKKSTYKMM